MENIKNEIMKNKTIDICKKICYNYSTIIYFKGEKYGKTSRKPPFRQPSQKQQPQEQQKQKQKPPSSQQIRRKL